MSKVILCVLKSLVLMQVQVQNGIQMTWMPIWPVKTRDREQMMGVKLRFLPPLNQHLVQLQNQENRHLKIPVKMLQTMSQTQWRKARITLKILLLFGHLLRRLVTKSKTRIRWEFCWLFWSTDQKCYPCFCRIVLVCLVECAEVE